MFRITILWTRERSVYGLKMLNLCFSFLRRIVWRHLKRLEK